MITRMSFIALINEFLSIDLIKHSPFKIYFFPMVNTEQGRILSSAFLRNITKTANYQYKA